MNFDMRFAMWDLRKLRITNYQLPIKVIGHWSLVVCVFLVSALCSPLIAQNFSSAVDRTTVAVGEQFTLTLTLDGATNASSLKLPDMPNFMVLSGPNQSTNMQWVNGQVSQSVIFTYILQPRDVGKFTIGGASINVGGKNLQTQPIAIEVLKAAQQQQRQQNQKQQQQGSIEQQIGDNLFLRAVVDRTKIYQGEQVTVTWKVYTRVNIVNYQLSKQASIPNAWTEDLEIAQQVNLVREVYEGKQWNVGVLKKTALFPTQSGTIEINPLEVECVVQVQTKRQSNNPFDQFFNDPFFGNVQNVNYKTASQKIKLEVLPLPPNPPTSFKGNVGSFKMEAKVTKDDVQTNEAVSLKIKISGVGNVRLIESPNVVLPNDFQKFDPKSNEDINRKGDIVSGTKSFEYIMIPRFPGKKKIDPFEFTYFDTKKKEYVTMRSPEFTLNVTGLASEQQNSGNLSSLSKENVALLKQDIRFIKTSSGSFSQRGIYFYQTPMFLFSLVVPFVGFIGFVVLQQRRIRMNADLTSLKARKASKVAEKRLKVANQFLSEKKKEDFYAEVSRTLWGFIGDRFAIPQSEISMENVQQKLSEKNVAEDVRLKFKQTIETCEFARYAPSTDVQTEMERTYNEAKETIMSLEKVV
ncbi:MAG: protein BatD [Ignavibacteriales bacterium]|nr:protein BatD [Ignavibacteriales bacterium]